MSQNENDAETPRRFPCPFVYATGKSCPGHIVRVEAYKTDLEWALGEDGQWHFGFGQPRSHYHLFCSEKGSHSGTRQQDNPQMKFYLDEIPDDLAKVLFRS